MNELVTIIVPIYKVEDYLHRCVDSILNQSYSNLEIILVNDGSPDKCGEFCDNYANLDHRIKVVHKKNGGLSDARNSGLEKANGKYISFVDSDDWIHKDYVENLYILLRETKSDIAVCNFVRTSNEEPILFNSVIEEVIEYSNVEALEQLYDKYDVQMAIACGKLYKSCLFDDLRFPLGKIHEDEFTTYKAIYKAKKVVLTTAPLYYYWQRDDSIIGLGFNIYNKLDAIQAFKERAEFFRDEGLSNLSAKTYRVLFFLYLTVNRRINKYNYKFNKEEYSYNFKQLRFSLRKSNQKLTFKVFYELYYLIPNFVDNLYKIYVMARKKK